MGLRGVVWRFLGRFRGLGDGEGWKVVVVRIRGDDLGIVARKRKYER